jgi:hypothetical protein
MSTDARLPDFSYWFLADLRTQEQHLDRLITSMAGQDDPLKPRLRDELEAIRAEIGRRPKPEGE